MSLVTPAVEPRTSATSTRSLSSNRPLQDESSQTSTIRVMTYNIELGFNWPAVRDVIRAHDPDIICLQEIPDHDAAHPRAAKLNDILSAFDLPGDLQMLWHDTPTHIGNLTLVKGKIRHETAMWVKGLRPYGMLSRVTIGNHELHVANLHLAPMFGPPPITFWPTEISRTREILDLNRRLQPLTGPVLALGDFNTFWPMPGCVIMRRHWQDARNAAVTPRRATRPTYQLPLVIDHIYARGPVTFRDYKVIESNASDHRPVLATLEFKQ